MNKRELGATYRDAVLVFLARAGYASTRQLARAIWGGCTDSKRNMCGRTLRKLKTDKLVVARREGDSHVGEQLVALTQAGATLAHESLGQHLPGERPHGRDWLRHSHAHRTACNAVLAALWTEDDQLPELWSELEVQAERAPIKSYQYSMPDGTRVLKIPDMLATKADESWVWFEIENTYRSNKDMQKLEAFMRAQFINPKRLQHLWFVITAEAARTFPARLRARLTDAAGEQVLSHVRFFELNPDKLELTVI